MRKIELSPEIEVAYDQSTDTLGIQINYAMADDSFTAIMSVPAALWLAAAIQREIPHSIHIPANAIPELE